MAAASTQVNLQPFNSYKDQPDYSLQTVDAGQKPFDPKHAWDANKAPDYSKQPDKVMPEPIQVPAAIPARTETGNTGLRSPSATRSKILASPRSNQIDLPATSISENPSRAMGARSLSRARAAGQSEENGAQSTTASHHRVVSPSRAMGARSFSMERALSESGGGLDGVAEGAEEAPERGRSARK